MKHKTTIPLYISLLHIKKLNLNSVIIFDNGFVKIPIGTEIESTTKDTYSGITENFSFYNSFLYIDPAENNNLYNHTDFVNEIIDSCVIRSSKEEHITSESILTTTEYKGALEGFPEAIVKHMLREQVKQGNPEDIQVFENRRDANKNEKGFSWYLTKEKETFWSDVINYKKFDVYFGKYPEAKIEEKIEESWVPKPGELVWIKIFSNWSAGYYKRFESQTDKHVVKEIASGGGNIFSSKDILPFIANPDKLSIDVLNKISAENDKGINKVEVSNSFPGKSEESYRNQLLDINQWCEFMLKNRSTIRERVLWSMINDIHNRTTD